MKFSSKTKHILAAILGFGLGGLIWGWQCWGIADDTSRVFVNPFSFIVGAMSLGIFGGIGLTIFSKDIKKNLKVIILGTLGWLVGFLVLGEYGFPWLIAIGSILQLIIIPLALVSNVDFTFWLNLKHSLVVAGLWFGFFILGFLMSVVYFLLLQKQIKIKTILYCSFVFALASLISPIIGNLIGNYLFHSLFLTYSITFILISISFGLSLAKFLSLKNEP